MTGMPKRRIINYPEARHFVTFSTYQRRRFLEPERTKEIVLEALQGCLVNHSASCTGFVIMPNHVHAILFGNAEYNLSRFIQVWKKTSSYRIKQFYREHMTHYRQFCPGDCPVWQAKFYDFNVESDDKLNEKLDYMHANPVIVGLAEYSSAWLWSSARFYEQGQGVGVNLSY
jgi:putative transposase